MIHSPTYGDSQWGDLLTAYDGQTLSYDTIGNLTADGTWTYTWEHGRQLQKMSNGTTEWTFTYDADGMRTGRTNGSKTYSYVYNGGKIIASLSIWDNYYNSKTIYFAVTGEWP